MFKGSLSIKKSLIAVFVVIGVINIFAFVFLFLSFGSEDIQIDLSGRNRMLSQKMAFQANLYFNGDANAKKEAEETVDLFENSLMTLKDGGKIPGQKSEYIDAASGKPARLIDEIGELWSTYKTNINLILKLPADGIASNVEAQNALKYINANTQLLLAKSDGIVKAFVEQSNAQMQRAKLFLFGGLILLIVSFIAAVAYINLTLINPVDYFKSKLELLSKGEYDQEISYEGQKEYTQFAQYLDLVFKKLRLMAAFIESIGQGKLDFQIEGETLDIVKEDRIFNSLTKTQSELIKVEQENEIRQWTNEGIRIISELLQKRYDQVQELYDELIATIVKYVKGNQGGMFLATGEDNDVALELVSCYAYERKKYLHEKYDIDEGLLGQAFKEKNIIYLTEVPDQYVRITSGLGSATPSSIILIPLKDNETVVGVVEIAAFGKIEQHRIEFLEKISELIASALNTIIINEKTKFLLSESQQQAEEMRAQEEEMRQNMEELQATQEEMARKEREITKLLDQANEKDAEMQKVFKELNSKERFLDTLINVSTDSILAVDRGYKVVSFNKTIEKTYQEMGVQLQKDLNILDTFPEGEMRENFKVQFDRAFKGESFEATLEVPREGDEPQYFMINYAPLRNEKNDIIAAVMYSKDVTDLIHAQRESEKLLEEAQQQTEEMKAQEEELKQNMEEMAAIQDELEKRATEAEKVKEELEFENAMFSGIMDVLPDRITIKDRNGVYLRVNKTKEESMKSMGVDDYHGKTDADIFNEEHFKKSQQIEKEIIDSGKGVLDEVSKLVAKDGKVMWGATSRIPFRNQKGEILGTLIVTRDISKEKNYEEQLNAVVREVSELKNELTKLKKK